MRLIDADALIDDMVDYVVDGYAESRDDFEEYTKMVQTAPTIDVNRPQGKWKAKSFHEYFCNNCGFSFDMMKCDFLENMKYCPNCGVRKGAAND